METHKCTLPESVELGQLAFSSNNIQQFECPNYIIALLADLGSELERVMWNVHQKEFDNPFHNTGNEFIGHNFEVHAYNWDEEISQPFNFKCGDIEISWYKYLGRGCTINGQYTTDEIVNMYNLCLKEIVDMDEED